MRQTARADSSLLPLPFAQGTLGAGCVYPPGDAESGFRFSAGQM